jgi:hypothetical protein
MSTWLTHDPLERHIPGSVPSKTNFIRAPRPAFLSAVVLLLGLGALLALADDSNRFVPRVQEFSDPAGRFANVNLGGPTDTTTNPFFQDLGSKGRRCVTCHQPSDAFSVTPPHIRERFEATHGTDPIFRPVDGANCRRAPYFHNGSARTLLDAVNFYDTRFDLHLSEQDKDDLVAFLKAL